MSRCSALRHLWYAPELLPKPAYEIVVVGGDALTPRSISKATSGL